MANLYKIFIFFYQTQTQLFFIKDPTIELVHIYPTNLLLMF